jgi:hypothetical protein
MGTSSLSALSPQFLEQPLRVDEMVVKDPAGDVEEIPDEGVA